MGMIWEEVGNLMALGLRMKNLNIMEVDWKIWFLRWVHEKPIYIGELPKKGGLGQFAGLRGWGWGLDKKEGVVFLKGSWYPSLKISICFDYFICPEWKNLRCIVVLLCKYLKSKSFSSLHLLWSYFLHWSLSVRLQNLFFSNIAWKVDYI